MDDLISEFITETSESLGTLDSELVRLEQNPNDTETLGNIFRLVHTIKGTCGFLGLPRLESVAHAGENVLGKIRDNEIEVTPEAISIVLEALDCITGLVEHLEEHMTEPEGDDKDLIKRLNAFAFGGGGDAAGGDEAPDAEDAAAAEAMAEMEAAMMEAGEIPAEEEKKEEEEEESYEVSLDELEAAFLAAPGPDDMEAPVASAAPEEEAPAEEEPKADVPEPAAPAEPAPPPPPKPEAAKKEAVDKGMKTAKEGATPNLSNQTIRVNLSVLENLMAMVGELVLTRNQLVQIVRNRDDNDFKGPMQRLSYITTELQEGIMKTRMQPIGNAWAKFPRLIRDLSMELDKKIELRMEGAETELDRQLLELIKDPLTHMVRNSCDHGLEPPAERKENGKPETGTVTLSAYHEGGHIIVDIIDDGRGVPVDKIKQKAIDNGMASMAELEQMTDQQIIQFIFRAGFSTAEKVTSVSGRGVGMDVVRTNIEKIGGTVELESYWGKGSTFHIKIPLTLAIVSVLIVESCGQCFAVPQLNVMELVRTSEDGDYRIESIDNAPVLRLRDKLLPLISLSRVLGLDESKKMHPSEFVVVCKVGASDYGLLVDNIYDTEEIVVKPVSSVLSHIPLYSGNTVLGDGSVIMILDPNGIAKTTTSDLEMNKDKNAATIEAELQNGRLATFLLFESGSIGRKAVPLELVSRLEEMDVSKIEYSNNRPVVQYRGDLMVLTTIGDQEIPTEGQCEVIVFHYDNKTVGLVVKEIMDIVNAEPVVKLVSEDKNYIGAIVMAGRATDVIDVGKLLSDVLDIELKLETELTQEQKEAELLFVEDSMFFRNLTVPFLSAVGYRVTAVPSAEDAILQLQKRKFDIIVTDIEMPEMNGFELAESIQTMADHKETPIIAFTSTANDGFAAQAKASGICDFVLKTEREKLIMAIANQLVADKEDA